MKSGEFEGNIKVDPTIDIKAPSGNVDLPKDNLSGGLEIDGNLQNPSGGITLPSFDGPGGGIDFPSADVKAPSVDASLPSGR